MPNCPRYKTRNSKGPFTQYGRTTRVYAVLRIGPYAQVELDSIHPYTQLSVEDPAAGRKRILGTEEPGKRPNL